MTAAAPSPDRRAAFQHDLSAADLSVLVALVAHRRHCLATDCEGCWLRVTPGLEVGALPLFVRLGWAETRDCDGTAEWRVTTTGMVEHDVLRAYALKRLRSN